MQFGWINFSKQDKSNAISVIHSLNEPGVLDELGFGILRNAFANDFFPGTSTLHTRSKYLYLIPYMLFEIQKKCAEGKYPVNGNAASFIKMLQKEIDEEERKTKNLLLKKGNLDGVIGSSTTDEKYWVERTPLIMYWSGLRTFEFLEKGKHSENLTYSEVLADFYRIAQNKANSKSAATDGDDDNDSDAGGSVFYPISSVFNEPKWRENIQIKLSKEEAKDLRQRMSESKQSKDSLLSFILTNNLEIKDMSFEIFVEAYKNLFPEDMKEKLELANSLNDFYYLTMLRYNYLLAKPNFENCNLDVRNEWAQIENRIIEICENFDIPKTFITMHIDNSRLFDFLNTLKAAFYSKNYNEVDKLIIERERSLKTSRAKINHQEKYDITKLLPYERFDYRFSVIQRHVKDILEGENA